ncbi:MAG: ATP-binding cassette domain-containing protein [Anaerolineales bacterium]|nr:ATP-binding cassette domain-containing protein [Chloroflexota bacterium]MBL6981568.1 ATP-binding cassette domain-containing protein [Anaerolineales bacterium]
MSTNKIAISTQGLVKRFGEEVLAVNNIDLSIPTNTIYALLGPNGAGKTTTVSMLTTMIEPTSGSAKVSGLDIVLQADKVRQRIGVTFQEIVLDPDLTGRETLDFHARLYSIGKAERLAKIDKLLKLVELDEAANRRTNTYSGGMKRRLELARGLITNPEVLFLDEPTQGLDLQNRANIWEYIRTLKTNTNLTLLLTTHYMEEAEALADRVGIMDHGEIMVEGSPRELIDQMGADNIRIIGQGNPDLFCEAAQTLPFVESVNKSDGIIQIGVDSGNRRLVEIIGTANTSGFEIEDISVSKPSLGDVFLKYTGRQLRDK